MGNRCSVVGSPVPGAFREADRSVRAHYEDGGGPGSVSFAGDEERGEQPFFLQPYAGVREEMVFWKPAVGENVQQFFHVRFPVIGKESLQPVFPPYHLGPWGVQQVIAQAVDARLNQGRRLTLVGKTEKFPGIPEEKGEPAVKVPLRPQVVQEDLARDAPQEKLRDERSPGGGVVFAGVGISVIHHGGESALPGNAEPRAAAQKIPSREDGWIGIPEGCRGGGPFKEFVPVCGHDQRIAGMMAKGEQDQAHGPVVSWIKG